MLFLAVRRPIVPTAVILLAPSRAASAAMPAMASAVRSMAARSDRPGFADALAQPSDLGEIDDGPPDSILLLFADMELHRVGPHVDDRLPGAWHGPRDPADPMSLFQARGN